MDPLPAPLTPMDCDLRDFKFIPIDIVRLFNSEFHARSDDAVWRAGMTLWLKAFHQVPAASIPDDDVALARLAELGRDVKSWKKIREGALYGWVKCLDGRLYHPVVAEKAMEAWQGKKNQRVRTGKARLQAMLARLPKACEPVELAHMECSIQTLMTELSQSLSQTEHAALEASVTDLLAEAKRKGEWKGKKERKGKGQDLPGGFAPDGADAGVPGLSDSSADQMPERMTKDEIWHSGKSLLMQSGMPRSQCGSFLGKLVRDHTAAVVVEAVRAAVVERPADPVSFLAAACKRRPGRRAYDSRLQEMQSANTEAARRILFGEGAANG